MDFIFSTEIKFSMWVGFDYSDQIGASKITMATASLGKVVYNVTLMV